MRLFLIFITAMLVACTSSMHGAIETNNSEQVVFSSDYQGRALSSEPVTWKDYYDGGTYLYRAGDYSKAVDYYMNCADLATGEAQKVCLAAAAVSALVANDTARFITARQRLRELTDKNPFTEATVTDKALQAIEQVTRY